MYPTLLKFGTLAFHSYAIFLSLGFLTAVFLIVRQNYRDPNPAPITPLGGLWVFLGGFFGARLYFVMQYESIDLWYKAFYLWSGGLVFYGGAIGGFLGGLIYLLIVRAPVVQVADLSISFVPLAHAIARVGCFLNGCCWGSPTIMPWGVKYPAGSMPFNDQVSDGLIASSAASSLPAHPTQLYETAGLLVIFVLLRMFHKRPHPPGSILLAYLFCYGTHRFIVEAFRGDSGRHLFDMTVSQWVAVGMVATSVLLALLLRVSVWRKLPAEGGPAEARAV
ncbi:MAG: hypothetical protein GC168_19135 [Candidatus Hydrogenedens sp.]|nr:hypothetical protein [Candidatus Hydrogenedens sp.]